MLGTGHPGTERDPEVFDIEEAALGEREGGVRTLLEGSAECAPPPRGETLT